MGVIYVVKFRLTTQSAEISSLTNPTEGPIFLPRAESPFQLVGSLQHPSGPRSGRVFFITSPNLSARVTGQTRSLRVTYRGLLPGVG